MSQILTSHPPYQISSWCCLLLVTNSNPHETFCKNMCLIVCTPPSSKSSIYWPPPTSLEQFLRTFWNAVSQTIVLILPQIKFNLKLSCCASFLSQQCFIKLRSIHRHTNNSKGPGPQIFLSLMTSVWSNPKYWEYFQWPHGKPWASLMVQWVKNLPTMQELQETQVWSLGQEDPLE